VQSSPPSHIVLNTTVLFTPIHSQCHAAVSDWVHGVTSISLVLKIKTRSRSTQPTITVSLNRTWPTMDATKFNPIRPNPSMSGH